MAEGTGDFLRKAVLTMLAGVGSFSVKYLSDINDDMARTNVELAQLNTIIKTHERQLATLENYNQIIFRVETSLAQHEKRIDMMEMRKP